MPPCVPRDGLGNGFFSRKRDSSLACFIVPPWHRWLSLQKWRILFPLVIGEFFMTFPRINPHFCRNRLALHLAYIWVSQKIWWPTLVQQPLPWKYGEIWNQFKPRKPSEMSVIILSKFDCHLPNSQFRRKTSADWRPICFFQPNDQLCKHPVELLCPQGFCSFTHILWEVSNKILPWWKDTSMFHHSYSQKKTGKKKGFG